MLTPKLELEYFAIKMTTRRIGFKIILKEQRLKIPKKNLG